MFRTITAKYPGICKRCGEAIQVGESIRYGGYGRTYHFADNCGQSTTIAQPDANETLTHPRVQEAVIITEPITSTIVSRVVGTKVDGDLAGRF